MATMGLSTALIGVLPTYASWGLGATALLVLLRLLQGLALGGEYGGAATYVAEHVPDERRGYYTSFIQTTATAGFFISMLVIGTSRSLFGEAAFGDYGWRVPFLLSFILLVVSIYMRVKMRESPLFAKLKKEGKTSRNPLVESFANPRNLRYVLIALFGATAGQGVVWYTGQFYAAAKPRQLGGARREQHQRAGRAERLPRPQPQGGDGAERLQRVYLHAGDDHPGGPEAPGGHVGAGPGQR